MAKKDEKTSGLFDNKNLNIETETITIEDVKLEDFLNKKFDKLLKKKFENVYYAGIMIILTDSNELYVLSSGNSEEKGKSSLIVTHSIKENSKKNTLHEFERFIKSMK